MNPEPGWTTRATVERVVDGDTIDVVITRRLRVRLLDCWAPEARTSRGRDATGHLKTLLSRRGVVLHVPTQADGDLGDVLTFSRVLGRVYNESGDVSHQMVAAGHATASKAR